MVDGELLSGAATIIPEGCDQSLVLNSADRSADLQN